jgi:hypothetical protein
MARVVSIREPCQRLDWRTQVLLIVIVRGTPFERIVRPPDTDPLVLSHFDDADRLSFRLASGELPENITARGRPGSAACKRLPQTLCLSRRTPVLEIPMVRSHPSNEYVR